MKRIVKGIKLKCNENIFNVFNKVLFEKDKIYEVLYVDNEDIEVMVSIKHNLIDYKYNIFPLTWVTNNFEIL